MARPKNICPNCFQPMKGQICSKCGYETVRTQMQYDALPAGILLNQRYTIGRLLGRGGFGITYLAYDNEESRIVAVKEYYPDGIGVRTYNDVTVEPMTTQHREEYSLGLKRFIGEAKIITEFRECSEILGIYDFFYCNGTAYYAMEFVKGISLKKYVEAIGALTESQAVYIAERILPALAVLHRAGVLHRDVSPDNIMLRSDGAVRLVDFGSARIISSKSLSMSVIVKEGFAPIEQYQRKGKHGSWTDIYSFGTSLFFALLELIPEDPLSRLEDDSAFSEDIKLISAPLAAIIKKAAAVKAENRYGSADEMLSDIKSCGIAAEAINSADISSLYRDIRPKTPDTEKVNAKKSTGLFSVLSAITKSFGEKQKRNYEAREAHREFMVKIGGEMYSTETVSLDLSGKELTNAQIANLHHLKKLVHLNLNDNYITDLSCLEGLTEIESIHFNNMNIDDLSFMRSMPRLKHVSAENTSVSDISVLSDKTELENLYIGDSLVTDISPIKNIRGLKAAGFNNLRVKNIEALSGMKELESVYFTASGIEDISPLKDSKKLKLVCLGRNHISDISPLAGCVIETMYLDNNRLGGHAEAFADITVTGSLAAEYNGFTEEEKEFIRSTLKGIEELYL